MKKWIVLLAFIVGQPNANAQNMYSDDPKPFTGALLAGLNFAQVDGDSYYGYHKVSLNAGAMVYIHFTPSIGASMELQYSRKGSRGVTVTYSQYIGDYVSKYYMDVNYIEVPILLHGIYNKYDIEIGASYNYLISSKESILIDQPVVIDPIRNRFNTTNIDFICGITHKLYNKYFVNLRYAYSITSIRPPERIPYGYSYGNQGQFNNLFTMSLIRVF